MVWTPTQTTRWKTITPDAVITIKTPSLSELLFAAVLNAPCYDTITVFDSCGVRHTTTFPGIAIEWCQYSQNIDHLLTDSVIWPNNCRNRYYAAVSQHLWTGTSVMIFCCLSVGCLPAIYLTCTFTKHLVPPPYLTLYFISAKWGRKELNLQCLPLGNWFTVSCNTANRCRFPEMRRHLTPYLCMRPRYAYSIRSARHHRNGRIRTFNPALVVVFRVHATFTN